MEALLRTAIVWTIVFGALFSTDVLGQELKPIDLSDCKRTVGGWHVCGPAQRDRFWRRLSWKCVGWLSFIKPPRVLSAAVSDPPVGMWSTRLRCPHVHRPWASPFAPDGHRHAIAERLMKAALVVENDPIADAGFRLATVAVAFEIDVLVFQRAPDAFDEHVVHPAAAPIHRDAHVSLDQHTGEIRAGELAALVVLKISGLPYRASASSSAATQNEASIVLDSRQERTARLAQSMTATR